MTAAAHPTPRTPARPPRVLFACGGTGGHVYPAIAIADAVRAERPDASVAFAGTRDRMEWTAVPRAGYEIHAITVSGFQRGLSVDALTRNLSFPAKLGAGLLESLRLVAGFDADVVVGTGGYVAGPVGLAASLRGVPLVLQEQNAYAGATNKLLARRADTVFIAFEAARSYFPARKTVMAGNPVRQGLADASRQEAFAHFGIEESPQRRVLLVMGGSLGAAPLNDVVRRHLDELLADPNHTVVWATGRRYYDAVSSAVPAHERLRLLPYIERVDYAYAAADLALCRAGAITCSELAATGTASVLVPSPNVTADHQTRNARALSNAGAAVLLHEDELHERFSEVVPPLLGDPSRLVEMEASARALARPDAAQRIARRVLELADSRVEAPEAAFV
jgi:UDP-N-acetylglucosamine--N-acetylmuramyl-(pentapeptide) pyrophosphoryl-undecaprenol N-acetylglucosamine transferase